MKAERDSRARLAEASMRPAGSRRGARGPVTHLREPSQSVNGP
jgi:hypothetical protein